LKSDLPPVAQLVKHVSRFRGKMLRPMLVLLAGKACAPDKELTDHHITIATVVEMIHMATLVHDDVLDDAELRRRGATINHLKGNEAAVILGDFLISHSYHLCSNIENQFAARVVSATTNRVCEGELLQLHNRNNLDLTPEVYFDIIARKTAALTATSARMGAHFSGADEQTCDNLRQFGESLGVAFQIQDDILDLTGDVARVGKTLGSDIDKVKLTLPLIHFLATAPSQHGQLLRSLLSGNEPDRAEKVRNLIAPTGSLAYAKQVAAEHVERALSCVATLPESPAKHALQNAARMVTARQV